MKTITLENGKIENFVEEIYESTCDGESVTISMYGYKAVVFGGSSKKNIRLGVIKKLNDIRNFEINLELLRKHSPLSKYDILAISKTHTPDELADLCLEFGLTNNQAKKTI